MTRRPSMDLSSTTSSSSPVVRPPQARELQALGNRLPGEGQRVVQNSDGSRVASRWLLTGKNNGFLGTQPDQQDIAMTGTAVWAVREDGRLLTNWVERASWEVYQRLTTA
jgi:hypothetical protein